MLNNKPNFTDDSQKANAVSRISAGSSFKGDLVSPYDVRIDGTYEGGIKCDGKVVVGSSANVKGTIECASLDIWGTFSGDVTVHDILTLKDGCHVDGNLNVTRFTVELGVQFNGTCKMLKPQAAAPAPKK